MNTVRDLLAQKGGDVFQMSAEASVFDAACLMHKLRIGGLLVIDNPSIGIFTERDLLRRVVVKGRNPATTTLCEVMTCPVITARSEISVIDCLSLLVK